MLDFPSLLYKGLRILMFQLSGVYCRGLKVYLRAWGLVGLRVRGLWVQGCRGLGVKGV